MQLADRIKHLQALRDASEKYYAKGLSPLASLFDEVANCIEDELRDLAYINACESDSPNSPDFQNVLNAELLKLGIEE